MTIKDIAKQVHLSSPAVAERITLDKFIDHAMPYGTPSKYIVLSDQKNSILQDTNLV